jgi:hypothetical protein
VSARPMEDNQLIVRRVIVAVIAFVAIGVGATLALTVLHDDQPEPAGLGSTAVGTGGETAPSTRPPPVTPTSVPPAPAIRLPTGPVNLAGCPPPVRPPGPPGPPPWHPAVLVPDSALPPVERPKPWRSDVGPILGKGMWVWQFDQTEGGDAGVIVRRAMDAGLRQLWIRVGSSKSGFYAANDLNALVGRAHAAGLKVIGWGFPYLYDPLGDARWTAQALDWRGPGGDRLDGFSADIEKSTEGVALTKRRVAVYLGAVRRAAGSRLIVATVYPPTDYNWTPSQYPYWTMAHYVDAFAPMVYWGCRDPGTAAIQALRRLATLRPVHLIGQAYNMGSEGGRDAFPSQREIWRFMGVGRNGGAMGASFWDWQEMTNNEWKAVSVFPWAVAPRL